MDVSAYVHKNFTRALQALHRRGREAIGDLGGNISPVSRLPHTVATNRHLYQIHYRLDSHPALVGVYAQTESRTYCGPAYTLGDRVPRVCPAESCPDFAGLSGNSVRHLS